MRLIKKMDGAISIFLCLVLTSLIILSGFLIDGARIRAGETQAQAAAENSMRSALAGYNRMLKDLYGLFAISDGSTEALNDEIEAYMNKTLMTELGISKETMGEQMYSYLTSILTSTGNNKSVSFLNLFDYGVEDLNSESLYNLAQTEILEKQIIDYMKYRGPRELAEGFIEKLGMFREYGRQSGTMKKKIQLDKDFDKIRKSSESLSDLIEDINNFSTEPEGGIAGIYQSLIDNISEKAYLELLIQKEEESMKEIAETLKELTPSYESAQNNVLSMQKQMASIAAMANPSNISQLQQALSTLGQALSVAEQALRTIETQYVELQNLYNKSRLMCEQYKAQIDILNKTAAENKDSVQESINDCLNECTEAEYYINRIYNDSEEINSQIRDINSNDLQGESGEFADRIRLDLADKSNIASAVKLDAVKKAIQENKYILKEMKSVISNVDYSGIKGVELPQILNKDKESISESDISVYVSTIFRYKQILDLLKKYNGRCNSTSIPYGVKKLGSSASAESDPRKNLQGLIDKTAKNTKDISANAEIEGKASPKEPDDKDLVSKSTVIHKDYSKEDVEFINSVLKGYQSLRSSGSGIANTASNEYGIDQLRTILNQADFNNNEESFSSSGMDFLKKIGALLTNSLESMRDSMYINEYAMGVFKNNLTQNAAYGNQPEKDFSGIQKSRRKTLYDSEVEYILCGMKDQQKNTYAVEAQILLVRFALNTLAIYMDSEKVTQALITAEAIAGLTVFGVPIIQTMILLGWAMAEAVTDIRLIMDGGKVPLYKIKGDWFLDSTTVFKDFAKAAAGQAGKSAINFGQSKVEDLTEAAKEKIDKFIETKVSNAVDKAFAPLEPGYGLSDNTTGELTDDILEKVDIVVGEGQSNTYLEIQKTITDLAEEEFKAVRADLEEKIKNTAYEGVFNIINSKKESIKGSIITRVTGLTDKLKEEVNETAAKGAENLKKYLTTSLGGESGYGSTMGNTVLSSMTALCYQDYLRLFLLMRSNNTKLLRIADLIQLNVRKESNDSTFSLESCNTYIRLKSTVSMKYLFMTSAVIPEKMRFNANGRHKVKLLIYQGY